MKRVEEINKEIERLSNEYETVTGTPTEVYSRIVGYYRSIKNWNMGKREEYSHRVQFSKYDNTTRVPENVNTVTGTGTLTETGLPLYSDVCMVMYFSRKHCPNCPPVSSMLADRDSPYIAIDVDTDEGLETATRYNVLSTPTVLVLDEKGHEIFRGSTVKTITGYLESITAEAVYAS